MEKNLKGDLIKNIKQSSYFFRYNLIKKAKKINKTILLPEGEEKKIIKAASLCEENKIANCFLLGKKEKIKKISEKNKIKINKNIKIIDPDSIREKYIDKLIELRKHKGMIKKLAKEQVKDNIVLATLILKNKEVDGIVSGISHTTANTIRPALQIIKSNSNNSFVSSIFFMLFEKKVLVYGDCAVNINPTSEQLSEIAIQSAYSANIFGINPAMVAMISYSTGNSSNKYEVEKIKIATEIVKEKNPKIIIDGPIQYDAAVIPKISKIKSPNSPLKGEANVIIFPDLNTGNTTYKAVQRSAKILSIGPILQGINQPVNDLSRGASVEDIVYTIAVTAIQSSFIK